MDGFGRERGIKREAQASAPGFLTIDLCALARNYRKLRDLVSPSGMAAVVKADAYGLGAEPVARALYRAGCRQFFVAQFCEAVALRPRLGEDAELFVLNGLQPGEEQLAAASSVVPVLNSLEQLRRWSAVAEGLGADLPAVLQFDTGMSRLGIPPEERGEIRAGLANSPRLKIRFIMSHLAAADEPDSAQNHDQAAELGQVAGEFPQYDVSFANSGGVFLGREYHHALARPGLALYGGAPSAGFANPMEPVVRLDVAVMQTRNVPTGTRVGYGGAHVTTEPTRLATLAAGYADGLLRSLSGRGAVYHGGVRLPIVGRVSMDSTTIDISALPPGSLALGDRVEVIGSHQTLEDLACAAGTIAYEILTSLGHRYHRLYL